MASAMLILGLRTPHAYPCNLNLKLTSLHTITPIHLLLSLYSFREISKREIYAISFEIEQMGSGNDDLVGDRVNISTRSSPSKKNSGKVPRKIHKAEREKLKRDHMNELFLDLGKALDLDHVNNGKASMLRETVRLLKELFTQVDNLKKENAALLSESNYVTIEKNELIEDTSALDAQIKNLQREIEEKENISQTEINKESEPTSILGPVFVMPLNHESQGFQVPYSEVNMPKVLSSVSRPRPRYPSSSDIWPSQILTKQTTLADDV